MQIVSRRFDGFANVSLAVNLFEVRSLGGEVVVVVMAGLRWVRAVPGTPVDGRSAGGVGLGSATSGFGFEDGPPA